jgi:hypothetical protein
MKEPEPELIKQQTEQILSPDRAANLECKLADIRRSVGWDAKYLESRMSELAKSIKEAASDENLTREDLQKALIDAEEDLRSMLPWINFIKDELQ